MQLPKLKKLTWLALLPTLEIVFQKEMNVYVCVTPILLFSAKFGCDFLYTSKHG